MERRLLRLLITRAALVALPFVVWFLWRAWARRTGREMGATPWAWLAAASGLLVGLSLMATVVFHKDNRGERYVPAEALPDGEVTGSRFEKPPAK
jgi:hypothetical protein